MTSEDRRRWNERYGSGKYPLDKPPNHLLTEWAPAGEGHFALDVACGPGHNALWMARHGYRVMGADISRVALQQGLQAARTAGLEDRLCFVEADLDRFVLPSRHFSLIGIFRFLDRNLFPMLRAALCPGGLLIVETLNVTWCETHPSPPQHYLLEAGELAQLTSGMQILAEGSTSSLSHVVARRT